MNSTFFGSATRRLVGVSLAWGGGLLGLSLLVPKAATAETESPLAIASCVRTVKADVVALDQAFFWNRLGVYQPHGMIYALRRDVVSSDPETTSLNPGSVQLRPGKRARPLTLRMNAGDCLEIRFENLLAETPVDGQQPHTRDASIHVNGMQLVGDIGSDGSNVGTNPVSGLVAPGQTRTYTLFADKEGTHLIYSAGAMTGGEGNNSSIAAGLFGAINVEPEGSEWYRSQTTRDEMDWATVGTTPAGHPILDYDAQYPAGHEFQGLPILNILDSGNNIVHADLNAIITGPNRLAVNEPYVSTVNRDRTQPFREFTVIFHDEVGALQAFPQFEDDEWRHTLHSVRDAFAINYGTGGIGAEILANRLGVGPMWNCNECKYEEFFLSSWVVGDPAMVVDVPANVVDPETGVFEGPKATKVFYPDDPSNVFHSYLNDHVKVRNLHAGPKEHHIFHLHAHQWLNSPDSDNSTYMDSQAIGPGSEYTYEISHDGGGNRNKTPGDAIFHCHFYPHFAQGMWALWRNHDVFELGTKLDAYGRPANEYGNRSLPDGEIAAGTPIPGVVPIPGYAMPPMPTEEFAGYPFYLPGVAGHRPPTAPMDLLVDGGLPRHVVVDDQTTLDGTHPVSGNPTLVTPGSAGSAHSTLNPRDMSKENVTMNVLELPANGTEREWSAMNFHATPTHETYVQPAQLTAGLEGWIAQAGEFWTSGIAPAPGAPFADPCVADDMTTAVGTPRVYQSADIQIDAKFNKAGWHIPQHRMRALAEDVPALRDGSKAPEPLFFRANTGDCVEYQETNLVPKEYEMDDFQVRTPTDVIGAHIHLVKFDVTASDGSANGYNYEDGALAPGEVVERIEAINAFGGIIRNDGTTPVNMASPTRDNTLEPEPHPYFGQFDETGEWLGARTSVQRWYVDEVLNAQGDDRTLRTVFTHDHYGPSTHQQVGLYASLVAEPKGSQWRDPDTGEMLGERWDGGPTSWNADILTANPDDSYREFLFQSADFALAYPEGKGVDEAGHVKADPDFAINPPAKNEVGLPFLMARPRVCPNGTLPPCPEAISADDPGTMLVNYRNEPLALRIRDPNTNTQAAGLAGDLSYSFASWVERADPRFNTQPDFYAPLTAGVEPGDPFTPLMRAYEGDKIQVRFQNGAQEEGHNFTLHGTRWLFEPAWAESGYRNGQMYGISEHFELILPYAPSTEELPFKDYLYQAGTATDDLWNGMWGIMRTYAGLRDDLPPLPNNPEGEAPPVRNGRNDQQLQGVCPLLPDPARGGGRRQREGAEPWEPQNRYFNIVAALARDILPGGTLVYNEAPGNGMPGETLHDPTAMLFVRAEDLDDAGRLKPGVPVEPLVLRANAGDCLRVTLENRLPMEEAGPMPDLDGWNTLPMIVDDFNNNQIRPSRHVGLHPQLVSYDMADSDGANVGWNPEQTVAPGQSREYKWYAGHTTIDANGIMTASPIEFGATSLMSSDRIKHASKGAIGALIIEPQYSTWKTDYETGTGQMLRAAATVQKHDENGSEVPGGVFRELAIQFQNDVNLRTGAGDGVAVENLAEAEDSEDSGQKAFNYRTEPMWNRLGIDPETGLAQTNARTDLGGVLHNNQTGRDPVTPILEVSPGTETRLRVTQSGGHARNHALIVHGHSWQELPFTQNSTVIGDNPKSNEQGVQHGIGPASHFDIVLTNGAGGLFGIEGDYLYRDMASFAFDGGMWGILRVTNGDTGGDTGGKQNGKKKKGN
jgi:hypothetical protein